MNSTSNDPRLAVWFPAATRWSSVDLYRTCESGLCVPCPSGPPVFGSQFGHIMAGLSILSAVSLSATVVLLLQLWLSPPKKKSCFFGYTWAISIPHIAFAVAFLLSFNQEEFTKTVCFDAITRATARRVPRCAASGVLFIFGYVGDRLWLLIWIVTINFKIRKDMDHIFSRPWIVPLIGIGLPLAYACALIPVIDYGVGPTCQPRLGLPLLLSLEIPVIILDTCSFVIQIWTFTHVLSVYIKLQRLQPSDSRDRLSVRNLIRGKVESPVLKSLKLLAKPILFTTLCLGNTLLFVASLSESAVAFGFHRDLGRRLNHLLYPWLMCVLQTEGICRRSRDVRNLRTITATWYYALLMNILFAIFHFRWAVISMAWKSLTGFFQSSTSDKPGMLGMPPCDEANLKSENVITTEIDYSSRRVRDSSSVCQEEKYETKLFSKSASLQTEDSTPDIMEPFPIPATLEKTQSRPPMQRHYTDIDAYLHLTNTLSSSMRRPHVNHGTTDGCTDSPTLEEVIVLSTPSWRAGGIPQIGSGRPEGCPGARYSSDSDVRPLDDYYTTLPQP